MQEADKIWMDGALDVVHGRSPLSGEYLELPAGDRAAAS